MPEVIFDAFNPDVSCHQPAPTGTTATDPCTVTTTYHIRGDQTPSNPVLTFRRSKDRFVVESQGDEIRLGQLHNAGFSESNSALQSSLFYSVGLSRWMASNYPGFVADQNYKGPDLLPMGKRMMDFVLAGSLEKPDETQIGNSAAFLKDLLLLSKEGRVFFSTSTEILKKDKYGTIRDEMQPRLTWIFDLLQHYEKVQAGLPEFKKDSDVKDKIDNSLVGLFVFLGTSQGDLEKIVLEMDTWIPSLYNRKGTPETVKDFHNYLLPFLLGLAKTDFFKNNKEAKGRLEQVQKRLTAAVEEHRSELLSLAPEKAFERSLEYALIRAGESGDLALLVKDELSKGNLSGNWLTRNGNMEEIAQAILPALDWIHDDRSQGWIRVDLEQMKKGIAKLVDSHSIQQREFLIGSLAALRFLFGKNLNAVEVKSWVKDSYQKLPYRLSAQERQDLEAFGLKLEKQIRQSLKNTRIYLPVGEAILSVGGIATGVYGLNEDSRGLTVGGFTTAGVGLGALATHYLYPTRNPYISDAVGGVIGGLVVFGLSMLLTRGGDSGDPGRNPVTGYGP